MNVSDTLITLFLQTYIYNTIKQCSTIVEEVQPILPHPLFAHCTRNVK